MTQKVHNANKAGMWVEPGAAFVTLDLVTAPVATDANGVAWVSGPVYYNTVDGDGADIAANVVLDSVLKQISLRATILALNVTADIATVMIGHNHGLYSLTDGGAIAEIADAGLTTAKFALMTGLTDAAAADMVVGPDAKFRLV